MTAHNWQQSLANGIKNVPDLELKVATGTFTELADATRAVDRVVVKVAPYPNTMVVKTAAQADMQTGWSMTLRDLLGRIPELYNIYEETFEEHQHPDWTRKVVRMDIWLRYNGHMTELGVLASQLGVHERTLRRAMSEGALHGVRRTARTLALPLSERRYIRGKWPLLSRLREALRTEQNVRFALLFGSAATGSDTPGSDVDVLVALRDTSLDRMVDLSSKLTKIVGRRVDLVRLQDAEVDPAFILNIVADGRVLVDRENRWARLRRPDSARGLQGQVQHALRTRAALSGIDRLLGA